MERNSMYIFLLWLLLVAIMTKSFKIWCNDKNNQNDCSGLLHKCENVCDCSNHDYECYDGCMKCVNDNKCCNYIFPEWNTCTVYIKITPHKKHQTVIPLWRPSPKPKSYYVQFTNST